MTMKLTCIQLDWAANPLSRVSRADWEAGVWNTVRKIVGVRTGRAVLRALERAGKAVRIVPWKEPNPIRRIQMEGTRQPRWPLPQRPGPRSGRSREQCRGR